MSYDLVSKDIEGRLLSNSFILVEPPFSFAICLFHTEYGCELVCKPPKRGPRCILHPFFIKNTKESAVVQSQIYSLFHEDKALPERVFKQRKHYYLFEEFHWVLSEEGWGMLKSLAHHHHDEFILMAVLARFVFMK